MKTEPEELLILGVTQDNQPFRPSDWAERLCGVLACYRNGRWIYSKHVHPVIRQSGICVLVEGELKDTNPDAYKFIMGFAYDNRLKVIPEKEVIYQDTLAAEMEFISFMKKLRLILLMRQRKVKFPFKH
ncbi:MAG: DUF3579 domain-containing protein [Proteobacteria bacterium]|nr:DUF3579 domain-containing protein [Pseudomonadota bacterium]